MKVDYCLQMEHQSTESLNLQIITDFKILISLCHAKKEQNKITIVKLIDSFKNTNRTRSCNLQDLENTEKFLHE